ncbi:MAG: alpha-2-macroglobulin family protein, partial [Acidobacteriota bacterium]
MRLSRLCVLLLAAGCGSSPAPHDLQVMSYSPQGAVDKAQPVEIRFDKPVVGEDMIGKPAAATSVVIAPAIAWKGFWQDRQTLVIEAIDPLAPSTRYEVSLAGELGKRTSEFTFSFVHEPLAVEGIWGIDADSLPPDGDVPLSFNQKVRPEDAAAHCKLTGDKGDIALKAKPGEPATNIALHPADKLVPGAAYTLACSSLGGAGGNAVMDKPYSLAVHARPLLSIAKVDPQGDDVAPDELSITISFTTPVTLDAVRKAVKASPAIPGIDQGYLSSDGTEYKVTTDLETETDYAISIKQLADKYGQQLAKPFEATFHTGDARPRLSMERGIFALEASAPGYPVWSRNVGKFDVQCAQIPKDRLVQLLTTDMNYDAWGGNDDTKDIDWKALHVKPKTAHHKTTQKNKWQLTQLDLGATCGGVSGARGVYLADVKSDDVVPDPDRMWLTPRTNRVLANVTDLGVVIEAGTASGLVWVTQLSNGQPVDGAQVAVFTPAGKKVYEGTTNSDGILKVPGSALLKNQKPTNDEDEEAKYDWDYYRAQRLIATIEKGNDLAVVDGNWSNGIQTWNFGAPEDRSAGATRIRGFIQSDRGLYRPGEQVHFKGIVREIAGALPPRVPRQQPVAVEVQDSRGQSVLSTKAKLSSFGGFAFDLQLSPEASLGDYYVAATVAGQTFRERFSVEEFRPTAFELQLESAVKNPRPGERLAFELEAKYLFGAPLGDAKVEWTLRKRDHVMQFPGYDEYTFSSNPRMWYWWGGYRDDYGQFVADGTGTTDKQGHLKIAARDGDSKGDGPVDYIVSTSVTDSTDQTLGKSVVVTAHRTQFYLGMHANEFVQAVGMPFGVNLVALDPNGKQVATKAHLSWTKTAYSCEWQSVGYRSYQHCDSSDKTMMERDVDLSAGGSHTERIYPTEPGEYVVKVEAKDAAGTPVVAASEIWVIGKGDAFWSGDEGDRMTLIASKQTYQVGDIARLVPQANLVKPTALVTIERDGILDARVVKMDSASEGVELAIADAWAPNVFARVSMVSGRHGDGDKNRPLFKMGLVELKVSSARKQLDVAISLDRDHVKPGEPVAGKITVTHGGQPVKAEVSLSAADEGILQLIAYETPNPMKTFYASYGLGVDAGTNWNRVARLADPESGDPDEGGDMKSKGDGQRVRSKFVSSAYWAPMLVTDDRGEVAFHFTAPDNLTAFRLMAVAADAAGDDFGAGELRLTVNKPLMAQPVLPRFMTSGDRAVVGVEIQNRTDDAGTATVTATANGAVLDGTRQEVQVAANGSARVRFTAKASQNAAVTFGFKVVMGKEQDAVEVTIPIDKPRVVETRTLAETTLKDGESWQGGIGAGSDVLRGESTLAITVDRTGVGDLVPGLRALVEYPYGCLEQTMSRLVPLLAAKDLAKTLDDASLQGTKMDRFVRIGVAKILRHQQGDGLFSLWPQSQTYPHLAAYALWGLTVAQKAGVEVPADTFDRGTAALEAWANGAGNMKPDGDGATMAMAAYVMAWRGKPDTALNARL